MLPETDIETVPRRVRFPYWKNETTLLDDVMGPFLKLSPDRNFIDSKRVKLPLTWFNCEKPKPKSTRIALPNGPDSLMTRTSKADAATTPATTAAASPETS